MSKTAVTVAIVGGGISGINAARNLLERGFKNILLLEAKSYLGGRISTKQYGNNVLEMGAQWIHGEGENPVFKLAAQNNLQVQEKTNEESRSERTYYTSNGQVIASSLVDVTFHRINEIFDNADQFAENPPKEGDSSVGEYVRAEFDKYLKTCEATDDIKLQMEALFQWRCTIENSDCACSALSEMSLQLWGAYENFPGNMTVPLKYGYSRIIETLKEEIPADCIKLNTSVEAIHWNSIKNDCDMANDRREEKSKIAIKTTNNDLIEADHVIVTCSLGYIKKHANTLFRPNLPLTKINAINRRGFGTVDKIFLEYSSAFWGKECAGMLFAWPPNHDLNLKCLVNYPEYTDCSWWKGLNGFYTVRAHPNLLLTWIAGTKANEMEKMPEKLVIDVCSELLQVFTQNNDIPKPKSIIRTMWHSEPYTLGSYSFHKVGSSSADIDIIAEPLPSQEDPGLLFAGEATTHKYLATTHGAMMSGEREAMRLVRLYTDKH